jgi:hypothetical protein
MYLDWFLRVLRTMVIYPDRFFQDFENRGQISRLVLRRGFQEPLSGFDRFFGFFRTVVTSLKNGPDNLRGVFPISVNTENNGLDDCRGK